MNLDRWIETAFLATRWLLMPLYATLLVMVIAIYVTVGSELVHLASEISHLNESETTLTILSAVDLVLLANLVVMVAISSYESFISKIEVSSNSGRPEWLGKLDSGNVKIKVAVSIVLISGIELLRDFMGAAPADRLILEAGIHLVFVVSATALAVTDRLTRSSHAH